MDIPRTTVTELKEMIDNGEPVTIIDARARAAYATSAKQIRNALYLDPDDTTAITNLAGRLDKDSPIVIY